MQQRPSARRAKSAIGAHKLPRLRQPIAVGILSGWRTENIEEAKRLDFAFHSPLFVFNQLAVLIPRRAGGGVEHKCPTVGPENQKSDDETRIADAVGNEGLVGGIRGALAFVVEADQEVRADTDQFPAQKDLEEIVRQHQIEHRETKKREEHEEARIAAAAGDVGLVV